MSIIRVRVWDRVRSVRITNENQAQFLTKELRHLNSFFFSVVLVQYSFTSFLPPPPTQPSPIQYCFSGAIYYLVLVNIAWGRGGGQLAGPLLKKDNQIVSYYKFSN